MNSSVFIPLIFGIRGSEWLIIIVIILILFGAKKIPELMKSMGKGVHSFKQGMKEAKEEMNKPLDSDSDDDKSTKDKG